MYVKSSHSGTNDCAEVAFHKATSSNNNGSCVEAAVCEHGVRVRDSKNPTGPVLSFTPTEWTAFLAGVKGDEFELPAG